MQNFKERSYWCLKTFKPKKNIFQNFLKKKNASKILKNKNKIKMFERNYFYLLFLTIQNPTDIISYYTQSKTYLGRWNLSTLRPYT